MNRSEIFYEKLAYLFYAVAHIDGKVDKKEFSKLHDEINLIWQNTDNQPHEFNTNVGLEIEAIFEWLEDEDYSSKDALDDFKDYALQHKYLFDEKICKNIIHTCTEIATKVRGVNQAEVKILNKISGILKPLTK
jgi:hypothetical protein